MAWWEFWKHTEVIEVPEDERALSGDPLGDSIAPLGDLTYSALPLEAGRNDIYTQGYTWPKGQSDRFKWYNNAFWGNRLPDPYVGIGAAGPAYPGAVTQKMFWTQHSPEQKFIKEWTLKGGYYPYTTSVQQTADYIAAQQALWASSAGHA